MKINEYISHKFNQIELFLTKMRTEPQISHKCDRNGNCYWQVYNPVSGKSTLCSSEREVKSWLERSRLNL